MLDHVFNGFLLNVLKEFKTSRRQQIVPRHGGDENIKDAANDGAVRDLLDVELVLDSNELTQKSDRNYSKLVYITETASFVCKILTKLYELFRRVEELLDVLDDVVV